MDAKQELCVHLVTSLRTLIGIVEDGPTLKTSNLAGPLLASRKDIIDGSTMDAGIRSNAVVCRLNCHGFHHGFHRVLL